MAEANCAATHRLRTLGEVRQVLTHSHTVGSNGAGHLALMANPVDGRGRTVAIVRIGRGEAGGGLGEDQRDEVAGAPAVNEVGAQFIWRYGLELFSIALDGGKELSLSDH